MDDKGLHLSAEFCSLPASDADKLLAAADGGCALLYIYLLRRGRSPDGEICRALGMSRRALAAAAAKLRTMGLLSGESGADAPADALPEYTAEEIVRRSGGDGAFGEALAECERVLGHALSGADTRTLFGIYDFLGLPVDVIMLLLNHCAGECRRRYGPGRVPTMRQIEREAYDWANREIMTLEQAEEHIRAEDARRESVERLRASFGIQNRKLAPGERRYLESWLDLGFGVEAIELAYDRTVTNTGQLKWAYMDSIIRSWHDKGLRTPEEIELKDSPRRRAQPVSGRGGSTAPSAEEFERMKRLYDKLKNS